jgi:hypothetical protein
MNRLLIGLLTAFLLFPACSAFAQSYDEAPQAQQAERILRVAQIRGKLIGFQLGDYLHANFMADDGKERSFFILTQGIDYFLALHRGQKVEVTYEVVNQFIPETGQRETIERIADVRPGNQRYSKWWEAVSREMSYDEIDKRYEPLVTDLTYE